MKKFQSKKKSFIILFSLIIIIFSISGCSKKYSDIQIIRTLSENELFEIDGEVCNISEAMILVASQKKLIEDIYGKDIWKVKYDNASFGDHTKDSIKNFLAQVKCMKLMAEEKNIIISNDENEKLEQCTDEYIKGISNDGGYKPEWSEVYDMYVSYYYYNKLMSTLISDMKVEVSDSDARIMDIEYIVLNNNGKDRKKEADKIYKEAKKSKSFVQIAKKYTDAKDVSKKISRDYFSKNVSDAVFKLSNNQISTVLKDDKGYYIVHCVNDYDQKATANHKLEMINDTTNKMFIEEYDSFAEKLDARFNDKAWQEISIADIDISIKKDFFSIYNDILENN